MRHDSSIMPQRTLHTPRLTLVPLADEHLEWEVRLDSDPEVMRFLGGRALTREEVDADHARRMAVAHKVDGLGFWVGLVDHEFVGWWTLQPAHGPDQPDDRGVADLGYRHVEGIEQGEVEYGMTREQWRFRRESPPRERKGGHAPCAG